jgi:hypothetical protein
MQHERQDALSRGLLACQDLHRRNLDAPHTVYARNLQTALPWKTYACHGTSHGEGYVGAVA